VSCLCIGQEKVALSALGTKRRRKKKRKKKRRRKRRRKRRD
jgi:hypothetical protein